MFNHTNYLIKWDDWTEKYSSYFEQYCKLYKPAVSELKSIRESFFWIILPTCSHIFIEWSVLLSQVTDVILLFIKIIDDSFLGEKILCPLSVISFVWEKLVIVFLYIWLRETDGSRLDVLIWLRNTGYLFVILSWINIYMPDMIIFDLWIITCLLVNKCQDFSSIDKNGEAS